MLVTLLALLSLAVLGLVGFTAWVALWARRTVPPAGRFVTVQGVRLHYVERGTGPVVLMLHGLASQLQTFTFALAELLPDYRLLILDRPGAGYSQPMPSARLSAQADLLDGFLNALGVDKALVVGHSLGGTVALALALDHPDRVAGLALIAPASQLQDEPPEVLKALAIRSDLMRWIIGWTVAVPMSLRTAATRVATLFAPDPVPRDFATKGGGVLPLRPWTFRAASRDLVMVADDLAAYAARQSDIAMPVGVLFSRGDRILDFRLHGETLRDRVPDLELEFCEGGHMLPLSAPRQVAAFIEHVASRAGLRVGLYADGTRE